MSRWGSASGSGSFFEKFACCTHEFHADNSMVGESFGSLIRDLRNRFLRGHWNLKQQQVGDRKCLAVLWKFSVWLGSAFSVEMTWVLHCPITYIFQPSRCATWLILVLKPPSDKFWRLLLKTCPWEMKWWNGMAFSSFVFWQTPTT